MARVCFVGPGRSWSAFFAIIAIMISGASAFAQSDGADSAPVTTSVEELETLIGTLEDEGERQEFIENLKTLVAVDQETNVEQNEPDGGLVEVIALRISELDERFVLLFEQLDDGSEMIDWLSYQMNQDDLPVHWVNALWQSGLVLGPGILAWLMMAWVVRRHLRKLEKREHVTWLELPVIALGRVCLRLSSVVVFALVAYAFMMIVPVNDLARVVCIALVNAIVLVQATNVIVRILFSPLSPSLRLVPVGDNEAAYLVVWAGRFIAVGIYGFFAIELLDSLGLPDSSGALLQRLLGLCLAMLAFMVILQSRQAVALWIRQHPESGTARMLRNRLADIWHIFAMVVVAVLFAAWALDVDQGFETLLRGFGVTAIALLGALAASALVRRGLHKLFAISDDMTERFPGLESRSNRYLVVVEIMFNTVIWGFAITVALEAWGVGAMELLLSPGGMDIVGRLLSIMLMIVIAIIVWEMGDGMISAYLNQKEDGLVSPRLKTLLPLVRNVLLVVIATIAAITVLSEIGVDTGPLLAGAGVVGLAVGFGAQTLVKDVITGAFIMFEDQFSVGDWIQAGGKMGGVESISIRTVRLRDFDGYVHTVPFGEITALTNLMRDFGYALIDIGVALQENTDRVIEVIREVDQEARTDEKLASQMIGDLEVMGVNELSNSSVTVRVRIKTLAGYQWGVRREYLRQIKMKFDEVGIEIPFPHMKVYFGEVREGRTAPAHVRLDTDEIEAREITEGKPGPIEGSPDAGPDADGISRE